MPEQHNSIGFHSNDGRFGLELPRAVVQDMLRICQEAGGVETGGILLGRYNKEHNLAVVQSVTGPPPDSQRFFARFLRGVSGLQELLNRLWQRKEREFYLGEWHHHPLAIPDPSLDDLVQMKDIARSDRYACPEPILVILSGSPTKDWQLSAIVCTRNGVVFPLCRSSDCGTRSLLKDKP